MCDAPADITHWYEQPVRDAFVPDFVYVCAGVEWRFLAYDTGEVLFKTPVVRREALVIHLSAGQVHPNSRSRERREALECPSLSCPPENEDMKIVGQVVELG